MSKHTPKPWVAVESIPEEGYECIWIKAQPHPAMRGFTKEIGAVNGPINDETRAVARLWVAAPDLLEALKLARDIIGHPDDPMSVLIAAAIAKAEGRT